MDVRHLAWPLFLAFIGGLLLNLMPCVFPILSLKVMTVLHMSGEPRSRMISQGWAYTLGILVSFWILVAVLMLQYGGQQIGWGFQLQSPQFVFLLARDFAVCVWLEPSSVSSKSLGASWGMVIR